MRSSTSLFQIWRCHVVKIEILKNNKRQSSKANNTAFDVHDTKSQIQKEDRMMHVVAQFLS